MIRMKLACVVVAVVCAPGWGAAPANLVSNGDFANVRNSAPVDWQAAGDSASVTQTLRAMKDAEGRTYAQLSCTRFDHAGPASHAMLAQVGQVQLARGRLYEFACRARAVAMAGKSVSVAITDTKVWANCGLETQLSLGTEWKSYKRVFRATQTVATSSRLQIWFNETGKLEIADVRLTEYRDEDVQLMDLAAAGTSKNLISNSSFEVGSAGWSSMGMGIGWGDLESLHARTVDGDAVHGRSFLRIPLGDEHTPVLYFDYFQPIVRRELRPLAASLGHTVVEPSAAYTLSCYLRASVEGTRALMGIRCKDAGGRSRDYAKAVKLSKNWERYSLTFRPEYRYVFAYAGPDLAQEQRVDLDVDAVQLEKAEAPNAYEPKSAVEISLEAAQAGGVFYDDGPARLILRVANYGAGAAKATITMEAFDFDHARTELPPQVMEVAARSTALREVSLPESWRGFYRIQTRASGATTAASAEAAPVSLRDLRVAIVPRARSGDSVLGINHAFVNANLIRLAAKAGVSWYRDWSIKWQHVEPRRGESHWDVADAQIDRVLTENARVLPLLPPFPSAEWNSEAPESLSTRGYPGMRIRQAFAPKEPNELTEFIEKSVQRYKDRIHVWEFLNEPIYTDYSLPADATNRYGGRKYTPADYVKLLHVAAGAMRRADPTCKVIGGIGSGPKQLTRDVIEAGILRDVDIFNLHIYPGVRTPEAYLPEMTELLKLMDAHGGRKPIWITEFSYYGADDLPRRPFFPMGNNWAEDRLLESEKQCADYTVRFFTIMLSRGVEKIFIHAGCNERVNEPSFDCALLAGRGTPRKLFAAMAVFTNVMGTKFKCVGEAHSGDSTQAVAFETGKDDVVLVWRTQGTSRMAVGDGATCMDEMGRAVSPQAIPITESPIYLLGPRGAASKILSLLGGR